MRGSVKHNLPVPSFCLAVVKLGYNLSDVGKMLGVSRKSVSRCIRRGEKSLDNENEIDQYLK